MIQMRSTPMERFQDPSDPDGDRSPLPASVDVLVAGARCAGAATALLLARAGLRVLVVDPLPAGRDALSTHALMRGAVTRLHRWGLLDAIRGAGTPAIRTTVFDYGDDVVTIPIPDRDGVDALYAPRRTVLDPALVRAAREAGARVVRGWAFDAPLRDGSGRVVGARLARRGGGSHSVSARWVVGADGLRSAVATTVGAEVLRRARHATATLYGYWPESERAVFRWGFRPGLGLGAIPTNAGLSCVFVSMAPARFRALGGRSPLERMRSALAEGAPEWARRLNMRAPEGRVRGFAGHPGFMRRAGGPGWALVGDAGYFRDPLTAHGITDALRDAEVCAAAVLDDSDAAITRYQETRDASVTDLFEVTDAIAALDWSMTEVRELHMRLAHAMKAASGSLSGLAA